MQWLRRLLFRPVLWASRKLASRPEKDRVFSGLSELLKETEEGKTSKGVVLPFDSQRDKFIIFSDQHKGDRNGADDFLFCEPNYLAALDYYFEQGYCLVILGDCEELWENLLSSVLHRHQASFDKYKSFINQNRFYKVLGNHDLDWRIHLPTILQIKSVFEKDIAIYDAVLLKTVINNKALRIFCTHGHQGDKASDGNWFSKFFISKIWAPLQAFTRINPNTPAYDASLKTLHNQLMYHWSEAQKNLLLITGHTHQPVFESLTHIERLYRQLQLAQRMDDEIMIRLLREEIQKRKAEYNYITEDFINLKPTYFNSGCCCFNDGDITGLEIADGSIRLIKWSSRQSGPRRQVLEEESLERLLDKIE